MVAEGFDKTATKEETATKEDVDKLRNEVVEMKQDIGKLKFKVDDIYEILERFEEGDILDLQKRIKIVERAVKALAKQVA